MRSRRLRQFGPALFAAACIATWGPLASAAEPAADNSAEWPQVGRTYASTRFSPLDQITAQNIGQLRLAYAVQLGSLRANESGPIVIGDTMFVSSSWGPKTVFALDARDGTIRWHYQPEIPDDIMQYACCDVGNRGVSYGDGKVFVGRLDGYLAGLDAKTGKELWKTQVVDYKQGSVITSPPVVAKGLVIIGYGGGEYGVRGSLQAYDAKTGKQVWKTWTVPGPGEPGNDTWKGDSWEHGGAAAWALGSYDPETDTVFYGTSNPGPWNAAVRSTGTDDYGKLTNLYTASILALDRQSGKIKWYFQTTPDDVWDYDSMNEQVLTDLTIDGHSVPALIKADRNGFFYVLNRENGHLLSAEPYVHVTWARGIDLETGRPIEVPGMRPTLTHKATDICPAAVGAKNWEPMSFNPQTGLAYITANNMCMEMQSADVQYHRGVFYLGSNFKMSPGPGDYGGELLAWDPVKQAKAWDVKLPLPLNGGTLSTAGNLVFFGDSAGWLHGMDAKTGKELWKINVGSGMTAAPMSFAVNGKQYIAVVVGRQVSMPAFMGELGAKIIESSAEGGALMVFSL